MAVTGIDLLLRGKDETGPAVRSALGRLGALEAGSGKLGAKIGQQAAGQLQATFVQYMGARALDQGLRAALEAATEGAGWAEAGTAGATALLDGFKSIPIAGVLGETLANAVDFAGNLAAERAQQASRKVADELVAVDQTAAELVATLRRDTMTEAQRRQADFDRQVAPLLRRAAAAGQAVGPLRDQLQSEFEAAERRRLASGAAAPRTVPLAEGLTAAERLGRTDDLAREQKRATELLQQIVDRLPKVEAVP